MTLTVAAVAVGLVVASTAAVRERMRSHALRVALRTDDTHTSNLVCNACRDYWPEATTAIEEAVHDPGVPDGSKMAKDIGLRNAAIVEAVRQRQLP